ncbi:MAG: ATP-dependent DNA helicase RecG [Parvibaculaceae bacterium]
MRPAVLNPLFASASGLKGVGPKVDGALAKLLGREPGQPARILDLMLHMPTGLIDRRHRPTIAELPETGIVTVEITVERHKPSRNPRAPYRVECFDDTGSLTLTYFHSHGDYLRRLLPPGERRIVSGKVEWYGGLPQIVHPDHVVDAESFAKLPMLEPVYPLGAGVTPKTLQRAVLDSLDRLPTLPEWQDEAWLRSNGWPSFSDALAVLHRPREAADVEPGSPARFRLAYDELLANQLALALVRRRLKGTAGRALKGDGKLRKKLVDALPYSLTASQRAAIEEILRDMAAPQRMMRLLQGDVGAGKTVVALMALASAVEAGTQGALLAPTDLLARQHHAALSRLAEAAGLKLALLTGRETGRSRSDLLQRLAEGDIDILIGTHAIFQEAVDYRDLGLVVIDEQHRFGVHQRLALQAKSPRGSDLLVMTATPIPRTLALTLYGDMDVSKLTEKPAGRQPIDTRVMPAERIAEVIDGLRRAIAGGARVYWVCPLVEANEALDLAAAEARHAELEKAFPDRVGLVHGRLRGTTRDDAMARFQTGAIDILIATTVIEVGVDVPEATVMVIENAERFGLAQLHQLRGRVGRGSGKSSCLLLYQGHLGETARARLSILRDSEDGFLIAEEDLRLRGSGEVLGTRQAGMPEFRLADLSLHADLLAAARDDAGLVLARDTKLKGPRGAALRTLLYLFERDEAVRLLAAG